jgi:hypothetical protein
MDSGGGEQDAIEDTPELLHKFPKKETLKPSIERGL